jgi:hypothetical protein
MKNSMMLVTSSWGNDKTFKLLPITPECPYNECIFDVSTKVLAVIGKEKKESFHMLPRLSDEGDVQFMKIGKRNNGKDYKEERKMLQTFYEYYVEHPQEIIDFLNMFAINAESFDYTQYLEKKVEEPKQSSILTGI